MFNLEDFKKYGKAVRRDGKIAHFIAHVPDAMLDQERLVCMDDTRRLFPCCEDGMTSSRGIESNFDLVDVIRPVRNISFSMPEPLSEEPGPGDVVYVVHGDFWEIHGIKLVWGGPPLNAWGKNILSLFEMGLVYKTAEDAEAAVAAIKKGFSR